MKRYGKLIPGYIIVIGLFVLSAFLSNNAVTVFSEKAPLPDRTTIIIDAGHGGVDGGATSCTGVLESAFNLDIALRLDDLMHLLGYRTIMIRTTDCSIYRAGESIAAKKVSDLKERVRIVNETENGILVSIHQNYFSDSRYSGAQVFYGNAPGSDILAANLQSAFVNVLNPGSHRAPKKADGIYLMEQIHRQGVLIECGFLSNPTEESKLRDPVYQKRLCCVIGSVLSSFSAKDDTQTA